MMFRHDDPVGMVRLTNSGDCLELKERRLMADGSLELWVRRSTPGGTFLSTERLVLR